MIKIIVFLIIVLYRLDVHAGAYVKDKGESLLIFENTVASNKQNPFCSINVENDFKSFENKLYFEYGLGNRFAINGYAKSFNTKLNFDTKIKDKSDSNYFYNFGIQYNLLSIDGNYLTVNLSFYDKIKVDNVLFTTSNDDIFKAFEYGISYAYFFSDFIGLSNSNFVNIDIKYKFLEDTFKDNFNTTLSFGRRINQTSMIIFECLYSHDIVKNENFSIDKYFYDGTQMLTTSSRKNKMKNFLSSTYYTIKLSSITKFTDLLSFKIGLENSFYKNNKKSYAITSGFWFGF